MDDLDQFIQDVRAPIRDLIDEQEEAPLLEQVEGWQRRIEAAKAGSHPYKTAVREEALRPREADAAHTLYAMHVPLITKICAEQHARYDTHLELEDLLADSWELFLRQLARYDPTRGKLSTWLYVDMPATVRDHLLARPETACDDETATSRARARPAAAGFDWDRVAARVAQQSEPFARLWETLRPRS